MTMMEGMNFAAIDIGTNAARLLIKNIDHNPLGETKFRKVLFIRYPLRLGMDVFSKGKIGKERAEMMMHMIKGFKQMMRMYDVVDYRACATSAMRDAKNGKALIKKIEKKTGIRIDLIEGKERKGLKVTYTTDTRPVPVIAEAAKGADLFICEGMYGEPDKEAKAREHKHMTFKEAAKIAKEAQPKEMWLTHFSPSLVRPLEYMDTVTDIFENAKAGKDGMSVNLCFED